MPHNIIDLSDKPDSDDGMYAHYGQNFPPLYAQNDVDHENVQSGNAALTSADRMFISRITLATVVVHMSLGLLCR